MLRLEAAMPHLHTIVLMRTLAWHPFIQGQAIGFSLSKGLCGFYLNIKLICALLRMLKHRESCELPGSLTKPRINTLPVHLVKEWKQTSNSQGSPETVFSANAHLRGTKSPLSLCRRPMVPLSPLGPESEMGLALSTAYIYSAQRVCSIFSPLLG